jgi:hypothetical protein
MAKYEKINQEMGPILHSLSEKKLLQASGRKMSYTKIHNLWKSESGHYQYQSWKVEILGCCQR